MNRILFLSLIGSMTLSVGHLKAGEEATYSGDVARLQGKWETRAGASRELQISMDVAGTKVDLLIQTPQGLKIRARGTLRVDESASPRSMDWLGFTANDRQKFPDIQGIYKVDGDSFVLCTGGFNDARPTEFTPGEGPLADVITFKRPGQSGLANASKP